MQLVPLQRWYTTIPHCGHQVRRGCRSEVDGDDGDDGGGTASGRGDASGDEALGNADGGDGGGGSGDDAGDWGGGEGKDAIAKTSRAVVSTREPSPRGGEGEGDGGGEGDDGGGETSSTGVDGGDEAPGNGVDGGADTGDMGGGKGEVAILPGGPSCVDIAKPATGGGTLGANDTWRLGPVGGVAGVGDDGLGDAGLG